MREFIMKGLKYGFIVIFAVAIMLAVNSFNYYTGNAARLTDPLANDLTNMEAMTGEHKYLRVKSSIQTRENGVNGQPANVLYLNEYIDVPNNGYLIVEYDLIEEINPLIAGPDGGYDNDTYWALLTGLTKTGDGKVANYQSESRFEQMLLTRRTNRLYNGSLLAKTTATYATNKYEIFDGVTNAKLAFTGNTVNTNTIGFGALGYKYKIFYGQNGSAYIYRFPINSDGTYGSMQLVSYVLASDGTNVGMVPNSLDGYFGILVHGPGTSLGLDNIKISTAPNLVEDPTVIFSDDFGSDVVSEKLVASNAVVTLKQQVSYLITPSMAQSNTFRFKLNEAYNNSIITVKTNPKVTNTTTYKALTPNAEKVYTISNLTANLVLMIEGIKLNKYNITVDFGDGGSINSSTLSYEHGSNVDFTITPNSGYKIDNVTIDGVSMGAISAYTFENIIAAHTINATFALDVPLRASASYSSGALNVSVAGGDYNNKYQYWIKEKVTTDYSDNEANEQFIWKLFKGYGSQAQASLDVGEGNSYLFKGSYEIIVRVKDGESGPLVGEFYGSYVPEDVGQIKINTVSVDGRSGETLFVADKEEGFVVIRISGNGAAGTVYSLYNGETFIGQNETGDFNLNISNYKTGLYNITAVADNGGSSESRKLNLYVFGEYEADKIAVIDSLDAVESDAGSTTFAMRLKYADSSIITPAAAAENLNISLKSDGRTLALKTGGEGYANPKNIGGLLEFEFYTTYSGKGIYRLDGSVGRKDVGEADDTIVEYYRGYARTAELTQKAYLYDGEAWEEGDIITSITAGQSLKIKADGKIWNAGGSLYDGGLKYAFYREDASGWVLIKDYSSNDTFEWTPVKPGIYNIIVRVKAEDGGSYEQEKNVVYTVTGGMLSDMLLSLTAYDYAQVDETSDFDMGKPYMLTANYSGSESVLYMFTVYNKNWGLKYLSHYSPSESIMFVPPKSGEFTITVRAIHVDSYGFKEISETLTIVI